MPLCRELKRLALADSSWRLDCLYPNKPISSGKNTKRRHEDEEDESRKKSTSTQEGRAPVDMDTIVVRDTTMDEDIEVNATSASTVKRLIAHLNSVEQGVVGALDTFSTMDGTKLSNEALLSRGQRYMWWRFMRLHVTVEGKKYTIFVQKKQTPDWIIDALARQPEFIVPKRRIVKLRTPDGSAFEGNVALIRQLPSDGREEMWLIASFESTAEFEARKHASSKVLMTLCASQTDVDGRQLQAFLRAHEKEWSLSEENTRGTREANDRVISDALLTVLKNESSGASLMLQYLLTTLRDKWWIDYDRSGSKGPLIEPLRYLARSSSPRSLQALQQLVHGGFTEEELFVTLTDICLYNTSSNALPMMKLLMPEYMDHSSYKRVDDVVVAAGANESDDNVALFDFVTASIDVGGDEYNNNELWTNIMKNKVHRDMLIEHGLHWENGPRLPSLFMYLANLQTIQQTYTFNRNDLLEWFSIVAVLKRVREEDENGISHLERRQCLARLATSSTLQGERRDDLLLMVTSFCDCTLLLNNVFYALFDGKFSFWGDFTVDRSRIDAPDSDAIAQRRGALLLASNVVTRHYLDEEAREKVRDAQKRRDFLVRQEETTRLANSETARTNRAVAVEASEAIDHRIRNTYPRCLNTEDSLTLEAFSMQQGQRTNVVVLFTKEDDTEGRCYERDHFIAFLESARGKTTLRFPAEGTVNRAGIDVIRTSAPSVKFFQLMPSTIVGVLTVRKVSEDEVYARLSSKGAMSQ